VYQFDDYLITLHVPVGILKYSTRTIN